MRKAEQESLILHLQHLPCSKLHQMHLAGAQRKQMSVAQSLFGHGMITYHRTDSTRSDPAKIKDLRKKIETKYGKNYLSPKTIAYGPKGASQDAHEAIRPTYDSVSAPMTSDEKKLLNLIDSRFTASQMASAKKFDQVSLKLEYSGEDKYGFKKRMEAHSSFDGFLKVYGDIKDDVILPALSIGDSVEWSKVSSKQNFTKPPNRFSDASIIKTLEKEGVGRPSTYASIIDTLFDRDYTERANKSIKATDIGIMVSDYLSANFPKIVDVSFTSNMESNLDKIADGTKDYKETLSDFNTTLTDQIQAANKAKLPKSLYILMWIAPSAPLRWLKRYQNMGPS